MSAPTPDPAASHLVRIGLLGCGVVGSPVAHSIVSSHRRLDTEVDLTAVAVRDPSKRRRVTIPGNLLVTDPILVARDPAVDVVIEVMGGVEPARSAILTALERGKPVVTANKELLARHGSELFAAAATSSTPLYFEASVGGAIPIVRAISRGLAGDRITKITGILNGTTNYILSRMHETRCDLRDALRRAQAHGYAEADPTADIEGFDAAAKLAILARVAFGIDAHIDDVDRDGISAITRSDVAMAIGCGHVLKLLGTADRTTGTCDLRIRVELVRDTHPFAHVSGVGNAIVVEADRAGPLAFYGQGAGGEATASAVLGDLAAAIEHVTRHGIHGRTEAGPRSRATYPNLRAICNERSRVEQPAAS